MAVVVNPCVEETVVVDDGNDESDSISVVVNPCVGETVVVFCKPSKGTPVVAVATVDVISVD